MSEKPESSNPVEKRKNLVVVVAKSSTHIKSVNELLDIYEIPRKNFDTVEEFLDSGITPELMILDSDIVDKDVLKAEMMPLCQVINYQLPNVQMFLITKSQVDPKLKETLSRFKVTKYLTKDEVVSNSKLSSFISFYLKDKYLPIKCYELDLTQALPVDLYHLLPLNQKFICLTKAGNAVRPEKVSSLQDVGEFYIRRDDIKPFLEYCRTTKPKGVSVFTRNARAFINGFSVMYKEFVYDIDSDEQISFDNGKALFEELNKLVNEMVEALNLVEINTLTEIVNLCTTHQLSILDRTPAVSSYLSVIMRQFASSVDTKRVLLTSMIYPLGVMMLPLDSNIDLIKASKMKTYENIKSVLTEIPELSLGMCAAKKIPIDPSLRSCVLEVFDDVTGKGVLADLPLETQLVRFALELDRRVTKDLAKSSIDIKSAMRSLCNPIEKNDLIFSVKLTEKIMSIVNSIAES